MANQIVSLAYYVFRARREGVSIEDLSVQVDYHEFLSVHVKLSRAAEIWGESHEANDTLVPLSEIDVSQTDFRDIVDKLSHGTPYQDMRLSDVDVKPPELAHQPYFPKYLASLKGDMRTGPAVTASLARLKDVMDNKGVAVSRANGLIVGRVQSGKTRNYIGLMLKAIDEHWNVILVLTSCNTFLAKQTHDRIAREMANVGANDEQFSRELNFLDARTANGVAGQALARDFFYWGVSMKEVNGLDRIKKWLSLANQPHHLMRVLIIDDESDNASPDSNAGGQGLLSDEEITEWIDGIRHAPGYETLAAWFESLLQREWPDLGANTHEADVFREMYATLSGNASKQTIMTQVVNFGEYRRFLGMDDFSDPPVEQLIVQFFNRVGSGEDCYGGFVLLLKSILDIVKDRSSINSAICKLVGPDSQTGEYAYPFQKCAYLGYTATPYANILNEGPTETPIYADFIQSLEISPQYFGAEAIFGLDIVQLPPRMPIVRPITDDESTCILTVLRSGGVRTIDANLVCTSDLGELEWSGLKESIAWAFCTAAARRHARAAMDAEKGARLDHRWTTALVNVDHKQPIHRIVKDAIQRHLDARLGSDESRTAFMESCRELWVRETAAFTAEQFAAIFNSDEDASRRYGTFAAYPSWEDISGDLSFFMDNAARHVHVVEMNCTVEGKKSKQLYNQDPREIGSGEVMQLTDDHLWIVSGGNTISRGLTLLGLTASYFDRLRDSTCVDTVTQMGRWFGYRPGYELLPRIWMSAATITEMKRIAVLERKLHASIADNFDQHFSPSDPAHYQQISSWGRQLSGRAFAQRSLDTPFGTIAATPEFYRETGHRKSIVGLCRDFLRQKCGAPVVRDPDNYYYHDSPLWENVPSEYVLNFLGDLLPHYPERSRRFLRGVIREISSSDDMAWDVVIGNPAHHECHAAQGVFGCDVNCATPQATPAGQGVLRFSARLQLAFYAMIPTVHLNREDVAILDRFRTPIFEALERKRVKNGGTLPAHYDAALPGTPNEDLRGRFDRLIDDLKKADGATPLPDPIHARLGDVSDGFRNRSSSEYMARVHRAADHRRPTLQLLLVEPTGEPTDGVPYVSVSFYWPDHDPTDFFTVSVDENPDFVRMVTKRQFFKTVEAILRERDFPIPRRELLREVLERLGPRCNESFFAANVAHPLEGYAYHEMEGRHAYCLDGWAADEEARMGQEFAAAAIGILCRERRPMTSQDLLDQTVAEQPKFRDFFTQHKDLDALLTDDVLNGSDITVVCRRPITYQYQYQD